MKVKDAKIGSIIQVEGIKWIVLEHVAIKGTLCLMKNVLDTELFNERFDNNWNTSDLKKYLNSNFYNSLNRSHLVEIESDLTADDGMSDYEKSKSYVTMLSAEQYRKYRNLITNVGCSWWLITPSTCNSHKLRCVNDSCYLSDVNSYDTRIYVRPVVMFDESVEDATSKYDMVKCDFFNEELGTWDVNARKTGSEDEDVIARIYVTAIYKDADAKCDELAQKVIRKKINELKNQGWIPCEEKLPEPGQFVIFSPIDVKYNVMVGHYTDDYANKYKGVTYNTYGGFYTYFMPIDKIAAWQPMPERYSK